MNVPDTFVPLSVKRGIRSREEWEAAQQKIIDDPQAPEYIRETLIRGQAARREEAAK